MKKLLVLFFVILLIICSYLTAQDTPSNGKALNFPFKKYGISIGNSYEFNGIRINYIDKNIKRINGLNIIVSSSRKEGKMSSVVTGINIGVFPAAGTVKGVSIGIVPNVEHSMGPINVGLVGIGPALCLNGISIGGLVLFAGDIKGLAITPGFFYTGGINGIAIGGLSAGAGGDVNGVALGGFGAGSVEGDVNGFVSSLGYIVANKKLRGLSMTAGYLNSNKLMGVSIAGYARINQLYGVSVALYNRAAELHGVQLGLLNYAGNNRKGLTLLPLLNLHF